MSKADAVMFCPHCEADLSGPPIPQEFVNQRGREEGVTHYSRVIGMEVWGVYDGILYWQCPDCGAKWHRWDKNKPMEMRLWEAAQRAMTP